MTQYKNIKVKKQSYLDIALAYHKSGLKVIPVHETKIPACKWKQYQKSQSENDIKEIFNKPFWGIAILTGKCVEALDIDQKNWRHQTDLLVDLMKHSHVKYKNNCPFSLPVIQSTKSGGYHLIYRCDKIESNKKLALNEEGEVILETRGAGGYIVAHPSPGYEMQDGSFLDIPAIKVEQRKMMFEAAMDFDESKELKVEKVAAKFKGKSDITPPSDDYNNTHSVLDILQTHGWEIIKEQGQRIYLRRPGSDAPYSGNYHSGKKVFICFSSSTRFQPGKGYDAFGVYAVLEHNGDFSQAGKTLYHQGFGDRHENTKAPQKEKEVDQVDQVEEENSENKKSSYVEEIEDALKNRYDFRVNAIKGMPEYKRKSEENWQSINDYVLNSLVRDLQSNYIKRASKDMISTLLNSSFAPQVDPIVEYFKKLSWDQKDHIETLCRTVDPVGEDGESSREMFKKYLTKWLVAAIANVIDKKVCRNHQCFILAGPQGAGKSTWIKKLCPPELEPYYIEQGLDPDNKDSQLATTTNFIFNLDDYFAATTSKKINEFKGLITKNEVKVRMPYGRYPEERAKICSFVASSNEAQFLHDPTGNRRFVPFEVSDIHLNKLNDINIGQVWAQAYHLYNSGFQYWLNKEDQDELNKHNSQFEVRSAEYEYLDYYFKVPEDGDEVEYFNTSRLTNKIQEFTSIKLSVKKVGEAARKLGFERKSYRSGIKGEKPKKGYAVTRVFHGSEEN